MKVRKGLKNRMRKNPSLKSKLDVIENECREAWLTKEETREYQRDLLRGKRKSRFSGFAEKAAKLGYLTLAAYGLAFHALPRSLEFTRKILPEEITNETSNSIAITGVLCVGFHLLSKMPDIGARVRDYFSEDERVSLDLVRSVAHQNRLRMKPGSGEEEVAYKAGVSLDQI